MHITRSLLAAALMVAHIGLVHATATPEEAKKLGTTLTLVGAEKAGSKDGAIPEYTGGLTAIPAGFKRGDGIRPDPFENEKPLNSISAKNMDQYADKLTDGVKALMKKYPGYRIDVYPSHRTAAFPKFVLDGTVKLAVKAKTTNDGNTLENAHAGFPFPIPKTGNEAMWNHLVKYNVPASQVKHRNLIVDASGKVIMATEGIMWQDYPYWDPKRPDSDIYFRFKTSMTGPARRVGEALLTIDSINSVEIGRRAWQYLPGQRRVKVAPELGHDTPNAGTGGIATFDDAFIFNGSMERFNFKLLGKKEMLIPYNNYKMAYHSPQSKLLTPNHLNPDLIRWEMHRVWVVEANLKEGKRHIYHKRIFYLDEDSWAAVASDEYDALGQLFKVGFAYVVPSYEIPTPTCNAFGHYDLIAGIYNLWAWSGETGGDRFIDPLPEKEWTAEAIAGSGLR